MDIHTKHIKNFGCTSSRQAYLATKQAVYCILYDRDPNTYTAMNENGERCLAALKTIVANAKKSTETKISSDLTVNVEKTKWEVDSIDKKYASTLYSVTSKGAMNEYTVSLSGELPEGTIVADEKNNKKTTFKANDKFKILMPITNILKDGDFNINVQGKTETKPVLYGKSPSSSKQDYALTMATYENGSGTKKIYYSQNSSKIIIIKQEAETSTPIKGVKFELLDEDKKVIKTSLVTDENGQIIIENLLPGKYYIEETKTIEGYILYDKLIEVNVSLNEEVTVTVENGKEEVKIDINKTKSEIRVTKLPKTGM